MTAPAPRDFPDRVLRDALVRPDNLRALLRRTHPLLADRLDYARLEVVGRSYGCSWAGVCCGATGRSTRA